MKVQNMAKSGRTHVTLSMFLGAVFCAALPAQAQADDVTVNWEALGPAPQSEAPIVLRYPGAKKNLPGTLKLKAPEGAEAPQPRLKPHIIPDNGPETPKAAALPPQKPAQKNEAETPRQAEPKPKPQTAAVSPAPTAPAPKTAEPKPAQASAPQAPAAAPAPEPAEAPQQSAPENRPAPAAPQVASLGDPKKDAPAKSTEKLGPPEPAFARVLFEAESTSILSSVRAGLDETAERLKQSAERIQLKAYGGARGDLSSDSRKLSLKRALAVYNYLRDQGVLTSRMDVRAFGGARDDGPENRVDIVLQGR